MDHDDPVRGQPLQQVDPEQPGAFRHAANVPRRRDPSYVGPAGWLGRSPRRPGARTSARAPGRRGLRPSHPPTGAATARGSRVPKTEPVAPGAVMGVRFGSGVLGRIAAVDPGALELLVVGRLEQRALGGGRATGALARLAALLAPPLPLLGPRLVGLGDLAGLAVEEEGLTLAVRLHAEVHRDDRRVAGLGRAEGLLV